MRKTFRVGDTLEVVTKFNIRKSLGVSKGHEPYELQPGQKIKITGRWMPSKGEMYVKVLGVDGDFWIDPYFIRYMPRSFKFTHNVEG